MREAIPNRTLAAELASVLLAREDGDFSPSELVLSLLECPSWGEYLAGFEGERGQPAAVGRFLNELGLTKSVHHRTRGSLYSRQAALWCLRASLEQGSGGAVPAEAAAGETAVPSELAGVADRRRSGGEAFSGEPSSGPEAAAAASGPESDPEPRRRSSEGGGQRTRRAAPVIGWRRRATDLARSPRSAAPAPATVVYPEAGSGGPPVPPAGGWPPPAWVGAGGLPPAPLYPGALTPYGAVPELTSGFDPADEAGLPLGFYWTQIRRHLYKILLAAVLVTIAAGFYTLRIPKLYESAVTLRVDFNSPAMIADASSNPAFDPAAVMQTEVMDATQLSVIQSAIDTAHLNLDPSLRREVGFSPTPSPTVADPDALDAALAELIGNQTDVSIPNQTRNIEIDFRSRSPETSAKVANALAAALIAHEFQTRQQEQNDSLRFMTEQFKDVKARMEREQAALTAYQHRHNLLNPDGQSNLEDATLSSLNGSFLQAQAELTKYQAEENSLQGGAPTDALLASDDGQALRPSYEAWRAAELKFEQVKANRGPANPAYIAAQQNLAAAHAQLQSAMASVKSQIDIQYQRAREQMRLVRHQLDAARAGAQAFNDNAIDYNIQKRDLDADQKLYDGLLTQIKQQQLTATVSGSNLRITNPAVPDPEPVYPDVHKNIILALLFSLFAGCGLAILAGYLDRTFTSPEQIESLLHLPLLGALPVLEDRNNPIELASRLPELKDDEASGDGRSSFAESILMLRTAVLYAAPPGLRTLSVTSAQPLEGKSVLLANLAIALSLHGSKVLIVDGDIRRPSQHRIFGVPNQRGLSNVLREGLPLEESFHATAVDQLYLMTAGPAVPNPSELVATTLAQALAPLSSEFDYVLVDSPPLLGFADAASIATAVEGTVLVARAGKTQRELVQAALQPLKRVRARVIGVVLNQVSRNLSPHFSYYEGKYYERGKEQAGGAS